MMFRRLGRSAAFAAPAALALALLVSARGDASPWIDSQAGPAPSRAPVCTFFAATNGALQTRVVTSSDARVSTSTTWTTLGCGTTTVTVPRGRRALATVAVDAEVTCTGPDGQWCLGRVLIGGVEGEPKAPESDSFAWANSEPNASQWESNAFTRTRALNCPRSTTTTAPCAFAVITQVRNHAEGLSFRVDDSTVHAQLTFG